MTGFVYVISSAAGLYKIGFTNNPRKRLSMLRTSTHDKLTLVGVVPATMKRFRNIPDGWTADADRLFTRVGTELHLPAGWHVTHWMPMPAPPAPLTTNQERG